MKTKKTTRFILMALISIGMFSFKKDDSVNNDYDFRLDRITKAPVALVQFTPDQADWSAFQSKAIGGINTSHDPDGIGWIPAQSWIDSQWDGTTIYDPTTMTKAEFTQALFPVSGDILRGIREVFYANNPFADNVNPTKAEVDEWHRIAINHLRALVGYNCVERQVKKDHCMFARSLWGQERKLTTMWDTAYPGTNGTAYGPCQGSGNTHCGASFVPNATDQIPYLPAGHPTCGTPGGAEGISNAPKSNIPWSIKWSRAIAAFIGTEGFWGGHTGPFFHRECFGFSFWDFTPGDNNSNAILRAKWSGALMPNFYTNPNP